MKRTEWSKLMYTDQWMDRAIYNWSLFTSGEQDLLRLIVRKKPKKEICDEIGICNATIINAIKKMTKKMEDAYV